MLNYVETQVTFSEIPDEITLCINISGCPVKCKDCHSKHLWDNVGKPLGYNNLIKLIKRNKGITCVAFMGGDADITWLCALAFKVRREFPDLKVAWYSGNNILPEQFSLQYFDFIKLGSYIKEYGPLNNPSTNQKMYKRNEYSSNSDLNIGWEDITYKFWKHENKSKII